MKIRNFSKLGDAIAVPRLVEMQTRSYAEFLQADVRPEARRSHGLEGVLRELFPIESYDGTLALEYRHYRLGPPSRTIEECRDIGLTYSRPLFLRLRCVGPETVEEDVYVADLPMMIGGGEFIINGAERVVVAQIHRSPGIDFALETNPSGHGSHSCRIVPQRGTWIEFSIGRGDVLQVRVGRSGRMPGTWLLRALAPQFASDEGILALFYERESVDMRGAESRKDLAGRFLAAEVVNRETGERFAGAGQIITDELLGAFERAGMKELTVLKGVDDALILRTLEKDPSNSAEDALLRIYKRFRPADPEAVDKAREFLIERFTRPARYCLGKVGRFRLNRKLGLNVPETEMALRSEDVISAVRRLIKMRRREGAPDDIDHLGNRLLRTVGDLAAQHLREGFLRWRHAVRERLALNDGSTPSPRAVATSKAAAAAVGEFFGRGELSQVVDQHNPLAQLQHERRLSALGPGGLNRKRAGFQVRDVHGSHYGRICPIETPEGPNIGLISSLGLFAGLDDYGFLVTPYLHVRDGRRTGEVEYLRADEEEDLLLAPAAAFSNHDSAPASSVLVRHGEEFRHARPDEVDYVEVSPKQLVGVSASLIPFLEHNDANRALMGSNMQRQAVPLLRPEPPVVATGMEAAVARNSSMVVVAQEGGTVVEADASAIRVGESVYRLRKFEGLNEGTSLNQKPIVCPGQQVRPGEVVADGAATCGGELSLGCNLLVGFMMWHGCNFEDAVVVSERLVHDDRCTSIHVEIFEAQLRETRLGREEFTRDIPNVPERLLANLDEDCVVSVGTKVRPGDILVGKVIPKAKSDLSPEERLVRAIFGRAGEDVRNDSLEAPPGVEGVVVRVARYSRKEHLDDEARRLGREEASAAAAEYDAQIARDYRALLQALRPLAKDADAAFRLDDGLPGKRAAAEAERFRLDPSLIRPTAQEQAEAVVADWDRKLRALCAERDRIVRELRVGHDLPPGVLELVRVTVAMRRKLAVGDKIAGRHGNKGVIARIVPEEDMPFLPDGTPLELLLNPLGVPSRMNVGQILEAHLGWAAMALGFRAVTPVFDGATEAEIRDHLREAGLPEDGKSVLYDGQTGEPLDQEVTVGYIYMMKLDHLVDDKVHARATGPYSLITQQPLGGKARRGGQRLGEMEVWALEAYGAAHLLQEMLTVKSDDVDGRSRIFESMVKGRNLLEAGVPLSFEVLESEVRGLGLNLRRETGLPGREGVGAETARLVLVPMGAEPAASADAAASGEAGARSVGYAAKRSL